MQTFVRSGGGAYLKLVQQDQVGKVTLMFEAAISISFEEDKARQTHSEIKRRFEICCRIFERLREEQHWGLERIAGHLPRYLRCELDGEDWSPDQRSVWMPEDGV